MAGWNTSAKVLGIVRYRSAGDVEAAVEALLRGGIEAVEVTLDTPGAFDAVERGRRAGWSIGVGTVLEPDQVSRCVDAGAAFVVSPGTVIDVIERALALNIDVVPGAFTPTEILRAHSSGAAAVKVFPASLGGAEYLRALRGPLRGIPLVPTGGIGVDEVGDYLASGAVCVGLGGALVGREPPGNASEADAIAERAALAVASLHARS